MVRNSKRPCSPAKRRRATLSISTERSTSVTRARGNFPATTALRRPVGPKVEHPDLLLFPERDALQHGPVEAVEAGHELPPGPIVVPRSVPKHSPDRHADLLAIMFKRT